MRASEVNPVAMMKFRWQAALESENLVAHFRLPIPNGQRCLMWDYYYSLEARESQLPRFGILYSSTFHFIAGGPIMPKPEDAQGYSFHRFPIYLATAVALAGISAEKQDELLKCMSEYVLKERKPRINPVQIAGKKRNFRESGLEYLA